ncbi:MAG TPA: hypothetical protein DCX08_08610 [Porticoccaceae bacterium]|nr:hypothetical protein [Porticoccaceae bacterium]
MIAGLFLTNSAVVSSELDTLIETSSAIVDQIDKGIMFVGGAHHASQTGMGISSGQLSGNYYISDEQVTAYNSALSGMVNYLPYGSAEDYLNEQAQSELDAMEDAIGDFTAVVVGMLEVQEVAERAETAETPDDQAEVQNYIAQNDMSVSQEDADTYNQSLDDIENHANAAGAFLAVAGNPEAVAFLDQGAMDNNTRVEDNALSYSASNQAVELAWASSETVSSIYLNGQGDFGLDIYASETDILNTGYESLFYNTGPTALGFNCFMYQVDCDEGDET